MRNPNGYGGIDNIGGNRRNPFRVRITKGWEYNEKTGKAKQIVSTLGYFPTRKAAMIALAKYNESPYDIDASKITFEEVYNKWYGQNVGDMGKSTSAQYQASFKKFDKIKTMRMADIRKNHLQDVFDDNKELSKISQEKMRQLVRQLYKYCIEYEILQKDYSQYIKLTASDAPKESIHKDYTPDEIKLLWDNLHAAVPLKYSAKDVRDIFPMDTILIMIYTGMRPGELLEMKIDQINLQKRYMIGGFKTESGTNRIIPIHNDIFPLVEKRVKDGGTWFVKYKSDNPPTLHQYRKFLFDPLHKKLQLNHLPHDGRHTFATVAHRCKTDPVMVKRILGHRIGDITQEIYTHVSPEEIVEAVNGITFLEK